MQPLLALLTVAGVIALVVVYQRRRHLARVARANALAATHGFRLDVGPKPPPPHPFDQFGIGRGKQVWFQLWRDGEQDSVFDYRYTTGSGKDREVHDRTCALVALPFAARHTKIGPEGFWSGIGRTLGIRDIEVESETFNDRYRVTSDDERFAVTLLDQPMIAWLLSDRSGAGRIRFELLGPWLLCVSEQMDIERQFGYLDWAQSVRSHMPSVLPSLYPLR